MTDQSQRISVANVGAIRRDLLDWYSINKRDLPWRGAAPYGVWISEVMLQQTQVATVIPYYLRFMERFPTVSALAAAPLDDVLFCWSGMGYYARARNLHRAAQAVVERYSGKVPSTREEIETLPGIGEYTSGAILSIAYNQPFAAIDANVVRVVCRLFGIAGDPKSASVQGRIRALTEQLIAPDCPGEFNQALMELGALVCDGAEPRCDDCPLLNICCAANSGNPIVFPEYAAGQASISMVHSCAVISNSAGELLIVQRKPHGLWGGLWEFPRVVCSAGETPEVAARRAAQEIAGITIGGLSRLTVVKHTVTRYRIVLYAFRADLSEGNTDKTDTTHTTYDRHEWVGLEELDRYAFSSPQSIVRGVLKGAGG